MSTFGANAEGAEAAGRFLTRDESQRVLAALPEHLADMAAFSLATGVNITGLQWSQVDLTRRLAWIHPDQANAKKAIAAPLNAEAVALITKQEGKHPTHVFSCRGKPIVQVSTKAWHAAVERAGIGTFAGTISATPGRAGMCKTAHRYSRCRSCAAGRRQRWCVARIDLLNP